MQYESFTQHSDTQKMFLGKICGTSEDLSYSINDLRKHILIVGSSQRDRINTSLHLLQEFRRAGKPFLIVASAEAEYSKLKNAQEFRDIRVYHLGDERFAPFRLNPFEFELRKTESQDVTIQRHLDYLCSIFNTCFGFTGILSYVLDICLKEIYRDRGWNPYSNKNRRLAESTLDRLEHMKDQSRMEVLRGIFPTLTDLYVKIDEVVNNHLKGNENQENVRATLKAVIGRLRFGGKGALLDTYLGIPFSELLKYPTILELHQVGNSEDAAFIKNILYIRLYEYCLTSRRHQECLEHMTFIEDVDNLTYLTLFDNLSSYGEGITLIQPIYAQLTTDMIRFTHLKLIHNIEDANNDALSILNLNLEQTKLAYSLKPNEALAYIKGKEKVERICIPQHSLSETSISHEDIRKQSFLKSKTYKMLYYTARGEETIINVERQYANNKLLGKKQLPDADVLDIIRQMADMPEFMTTMRRYFISGMIQPHRFVYEYLDVRRALKRFMAIHQHTLGLQEMDMIVVEERILATVLERIIEEHGVRYGWLYKDVAQLYDTTLKMFLHIYWMRRDDINDAEQVWLQVKDIAKQSSNTFKELSSLRNNQEGPFAGCIYCEAKCFYRLDAEVVIRSRRFREEVEEAWKPKDREKVWRELTTAMYEGAERALIISSSDSEKSKVDEVAQALALCVAVQRAPHDVSGESVQERMVKKIIDRIPGVVEMRAKKV